MIRSDEIRETGELQRLLERCKRGDTDAWDLLVRRFNGLVYSIARKYRLNNDDSSDVFQATFTALHRNLDKIEHGAALPKWLSVTASRESQRIYRISTRTESFDAMSLDELVSREDEVAERDAIASIRGQAVRDSLLELPKRCRDLLTGLYLEESTDYASVASRLGIPMGAIGPTRARCLEKLRKNLDKVGFFEENVY